MGEWWTCPKCGAKWPQDHDEDDGATDCAHCWLDEAFDVYSVPAGGDDG